MVTWTVRSPQQFTSDEPVRRLKVALVAGRVSVVGADGPARVDITRVGRRPLSVEQRDDLLVVRTEREPGVVGWLKWATGWGREIKAEVSIAVPPHTVANLNVVAGDGVVSGLREHTDVDVTAGEVTLLGVGGHTRATVVSGTVEALGASGGLDLGTTSGELTLADSSADRVVARTVSGAVTCDLDNPAHSDIRLSTVSGSITVRVREDSDLDVHLHTTSGRITSAFPEVRQDDRPGTERVRGVLGAGAGRLDANATSGSIALLSRPASEGQGERA